MAAAKKKDDKSKRDAATEALPPRDPLFEKIRGQCGNPVADVLEQMYDDLQALKARDAGEKRTS